MNLHFNRRHFLLSFGILSAGWLLSNYLLFASKGQIAFHPDFLSILTWAWDGKQDYIKTFGIYMPVIPYLVACFGFFFDSLAAMTDNANYLKSVFILIDAATFAWVIALLPARSIKQIWFYSALTVVNFPLIYNSIFWGQVDTLHTFIIFCCFVSLVYRNYKMVWGLFTVAVLTKIVSIIFLPIISLFVLNELLCKRISFRQSLVDLMIVPAVSLLLLLPIIFTGNFFNYFELTKQVLSEYDSVSSNAYNIYYLISNRTDLISISSSVPLFRSMTFNQFGLITFSIVFFVCLFPVFKTIYNNTIWGKSTPISTKQLVLIFALTPILFFFFTTKIRERFSHPYLVFLTLYCFYNRRFIFWYLATFIYFLQLESVLEYTRVYGGVFISLFEETNFYEPTFIASLFCALIVYLLHLQLRKQPEKV